MSTALLDFLRPLHQDLDGISHFDEVERVGAIARTLYDSNDPTFERLILFHKLGRWMEKVGNLSRASLATGISEADLRRTSASIARLDHPQTEAEFALAAAILIDAAGVRGLAERLAHSRREGKSVLDVARVGSEENEVPEWMSANAREMLAERRKRRKEFCEAILAEGRTASSARAAKPRA